MLKEKYASVHLPENIKYLFDNIVIDIASFLCVMGCFRKRITMDEILFYYSIAVSQVDLKEENNSLKIGVKHAKYETNSLYLYMKENMQYIITYLAHYEYINLIVESENSNKILISINEKGKSCIKNLKNDYFKDLIHRTKQVIKNAKYTKANRDKVFRGEYYDVN